MSPEQWSQKLYGDSNHKSKMQSIIDKLHSQQTLKKLIDDFFRKIEKFQENTFNPYSETPATVFTDVRSIFMKFSMMDENVYNNVSSKLSLSDSQSTIETSDNETSSVENSTHSSSNNFQPKQFYILPWNYIEEIMIACLKILEASFCYNEMIVSYAPSTALFNDNSSMLKTNFKQQISPFQLPANIELQSRSISAQKPQLSKINNNKSQQEQQFLFKNNNNNKKKETGFARQFPAAFLSEQKQQQNYFSINNQPPQLAQYNKLSLQAHMHQQQQQQFQNMGDFLNYQKKNLPSFINNHYQVNLFLKSKNY